MILWRQIKKKENSVVVFPLKSIAIIFVPRFAVFDGTISAQCKSATLI